MDRARAADAVFRNYDFGHGIEIEENFEGEGEGLILDPETAAQIEYESREWKCTPTGNEWTRPVYVLTDGGGDAPYWVRLLFTVRFYPTSAHVMDAYALDGDGSIWGRIYEEAEGRAGREESLIKGPWRWRWITSNDKETVAMILETTARPTEDPVIMQALVGKRVLTVGERAAALELMRLAPEMLRLLAEIVRASRESSEGIPAYAAEAEALLEDLTSSHYSVDFRVPGYWSAEE